MARQSRAREYRKTAVSAGNARDSGFHPSLSGEKGGLLIGRVWRPVSRDFSRAWFLLGGGHQKREVVLPNRETEVSAAMNYYTGS